MPQQMRAKIPIGYRVVPPKPGQPQRCLVFDYPDGSSEAVALTDGAFRALLADMQASLGVEAPKERLDS